MKPIVFEGSVLGDGPITGVARSFLDSLLAWRQQTDRPAVFLAPDPDHLPEPLEGFELMEGPTGFFAKRRHMPSLLTRIGAGLLHAPVAAIPRSSPCPVVATIHDLPWLYRDLRGEPGSRLAHRLAASRAMHCASAVIVPSAATAEDLRRFRPRARVPIHMIPHGTFLPETTAPAADLVGPFLVLGDDRPRKNRERVAAAHAMALQQCPDLPGIRFVGPPGDYVPEQEKIAQLRRARGLVHLSLLEGFGLPVLEAMAHGVPVLCSNRGSLPEVAGDAALTADPTDVQEMAAGLVRLHRDDALRERLCHGGPRRAARFSVAETAARWRSLHDLLLGEGGT